MKFKKIKTDRLLGISAMIISLLTLIIFIYQTGIIREQSKLSVKPRLDFTINQGGNDTLVVFQQVLENKGLGPAIIDSIYFTYKGKTFPLDTENLFEDQFPKLLDYGYLTQHATLGRGSTLMPGEERSLSTYNIPVAKLDSVFYYLNVGPDDDPPFQVHAVYTSIYEDEFWKVDSNSSQPEKLDKR
ncbi:hypothetical protein [Spongiivirga citrea]|uniref:Uncharacterized protein n=1 Tax=Spongiivirga citrea TaxID=1481457 RepID=A0A6M0CNI1_9FLAO|nr:hypothetical protein [Spongiivirga citrea]NER17419.1 hypothetical protein [Spongiivirga citrea]